ncbi:protein FAM200B-like [Aphis craccivora]|uniref:Protein FAM200B-like n=1 Tax=Aphis craccivora TaxID=307492 RepID=A0A6G0VNT7_APHCR|nr:protein FAM200B-like [Aphis craccivora]
MSKAKKRKCHFLDEYTKEWSFIKKGRTDEEALCVICNCFLSVTHGGKADVKHHISTTNHKKKFTVVSTSSPISKFMIKQDTQEELLITAAELTTAYKVVKHHQSFSSLDCIVKLNAMMYSDSKIAAKQSTARTKATAIIKNILAPNSVSEIKKKIARSFILRNRH